jgi:hypothetical protein
VNCLQGCEAHRLTPHSRITASAPFFSALPATGLIPLQSILQSSVKRIEAYLNVLTEDVEEQSALHEPMPERDTGFIRNSSIEPAHTCEKQSLKS